MAARSDMKTAVIMPMDKIAGWVGSKFVTFINTSTRSFIVKISDNPNAVIWLSGSVGGDEISFQRVVKSCTVQMITVPAGSKKEVLISTSDIYVTLARESSDRRSKVIVYEARQFSHGTTIKIAPRHDIAEVKRISNRAWNT